MTRADSKTRETQRDEYRSADQWGQIRDHDALDFAMGARLARTLHALERLVGLACLRARWSRRYAEWLQ